MFRTVAAMLITAAGFSAQAADAPAPVQADYIASGLGQITAKVLVINSADDERNPPETGLLLDALKQVRSASYYQIPASTETRGHGTTSAAKFYQQPLRGFLATLPKNGS